VSAPGQRAGQRAELAPARTARRRLSPGARRTELLDAAVRVLRERGAAACRVEDVTAAAGTAKGNFYRYFPTWEALLIAVRDHLLDSYRDDLARRYADVGRIDWWSALDSEVDRFLEFQLGLGGLHEAIFHGPAASAEPIGPQRSAASSVAWFVTAGIADGAFAAADVEITAGLLFALLHAAADAITSGSDRARVTRATRDLVHRMLRPERE
jgi:AcrR family transcriptional regulator